MRLLLPLLIVNLLGIAYAGQQLVMQPDKRLKAVISDNAMNRLAVVNDRITQVFGDQEAYELQSEETTGQIFIKPTAENEKKPLSLTIITESGVTQDILLQPSSQAATTVLFKKAMTKEAKEPQTHPSFEAAPLGAAASSYHEQLIVAVKHIISGAAEQITYEPVTFHKFPKGIEVKFIEGYELHGFRGSKWQIKNTGNVVVDILEKDYYKQGDLAIAITNRHLLPNTGTVMYVVSR